MLYQFARNAPMRKITISGAPHVSAREALSLITDAISDEPERARAIRVGRRIVAEVPTDLSTLVIKRRLADAGFDAEVDTVIRFT